MNVGSIWNGWEVAENIGEGSFGTVYRIVREDYGYKYESALKVIRIPQSKAEEKSIRHDGMSDAEVSTYFESMVHDIVAEFALMSQLRGESNIVSFEDHQVKQLEDEFGWEIFIRMELLTPLYDYLKNHTMTIRDVIQLGIDMCKALEVCQKYNIIHRDIKPENIFVSKQGNFKLGDFGIARQLEKTSSGLSKKGTFSYMAPEVYKGQAYNSTVDVYSLGIVLYRYVNNNRTPFLPPYPEPIRYSDKEMANVKRMSGEELPIPCNARGRLAEIILKACAYNPKERYESASEMKNALESIAYSEEESRIIYPAGDELDNIGPTTSDQVISHPEEIGLTVAMFEKASDEIAKEGIQGNQEDETYTLRQEGENKESEYDSQPIEQICDTKNDKDSEEQQKKYIASEKEKTVEAHNKNYNRFIKRPVVIISGIIVLIALCCIPLVYGYYHHEVPNLVNASEKEAMTLLADEGLEYHEKGREFSDTVDKGSIISQSIEKGSLVKKGTEISVVVSRGEAIEVPDLEGKTLKSATEIIENIGLVIEVEKKRYSDTVPKGSIISQNPEKGTICEHGETVKVVKSKGIEQVKVPDVVGNTQEAAEKALKDAKLNSSVTTAYSSTVESGKVMSQSEEAGSKVDKKSIVTITISVGPAPVYKSSSSSSGRSSGKSNNSRSKKSGGGSGKSNGWGEEF